MKLRGARGCFGLWCITQARVVPSFPSFPDDVFALLGLLFLESSPAGISLDLNLCKYGSTGASCVAQNRSWNENAGFAHGLELSLNVNFLGFVHFKNEICFCISITSKNQISLFVFKIRGKSQEQDIH